MYESYWQLNEKPFENNSDERFYYPSEVHQGALLKLRYVIEHHRTAALLAAPAGLGKTLMIQILTRQLPDEYAPIIHVVYPDMPHEQLLAFIAKNLGDALRRKVEPEDVLQEVSASCLNSLKDVDLSPYDDREEFFADLKAAARAQPP